MIDLRSDTVTKPVPEMREAMARAEVGDDVYGEDPSINRLEEGAAETLGMESALFVPSGMMGNQIAVNIHTRPGDELILDSECHIFNYEMASMSSFSGVMPRPIATEGVHLPVDKVKGAIRTAKYYLSRTGLITLENTHNMKGGAIYPRDEAEELIELAEGEGIPIHLDGARIFNAAMASGRPVGELVEGFDSTMFCLSKGLGAPVGSMLVGSQGFVEEARRVRKRLGGGMRQAGILAAAGIYALENHVERLQEDHRRARALAERLGELEGIELEPPETNIVIFRIEDPDLEAEELVERLRKRGVLVGAYPPGRIRLVTHLDVGDEDVERAAEIVESALRGV